MKREYYRVQKITGETVSEKNTMFKKHKACVVAKADTIRELIKKLEENG